MHQPRIDARQEDTDDLDELVLKSQMQNDSPLVIASLLALGLLMVAQQIVVWAGPHRVQAWVQQL